MPTKRPASSPSTPIKSYGTNGCNGKCGQCEGDCDDDDDCKNGLRCFLRDALEPVPGCSGDGHGGESFGLLMDSLFMHARPLYITSLIPVPCDI